MIKLNSFEIKLIAGGQPVNLPGPIPVPSGIPPVGPFIQPNPIPTQPTHPFPIFR
jgi:hypothetical protein